MLRFRPILMTTLAALFGAVPLTLGGGEGMEMRQPLGLGDLGGLIVTQLLTLFTTPVIYLAFDKLGRRFGGKKDDEVAPSASRDLVPAEPHDLVPVPGTLKRIEP